MCPRAAPLRGSQGAGRCLSSPVPRRAKRSPAADAGLGCRRKPPQSGRTGGSGGHFALGIMAPRRPFCPLSAGGKWTNAPQRFAAGSPVDLTASVAGKTGSLRQDGGTRRRGPLCGERFTLYRWAAGRLKRSTDLFSAAAGRISPAFSSAQRVMAGPTSS